MGDELWHSEKFEELEELPPSAIQAMAFDAVDEILPDDKWQVSKGKKWDLQRTQLEQGRQPGAPKLSSWAYISRIAAAKKPAWFERLLSPILPPHRYPTSGIGDTAMEPFSKVMEMGFEIHAEEELKSAMKKALDKGGDPVAVAPYLAGNVVANIDLVVTVYVMDPSPEVCIVFPQARLSLTWEGQKRSVGKVINFDSPSEFHLGTTWKEGNDFERWSGPINKKEVFKFVGTG